MMIEAWNDFPLLRSQLDICYGSFSHKTQHFWNEMMMAHHRYEMGGSESESGLSLLDSPEIIGHSRGQGVPNDNPTISVFQLKEIEVPQPLFDEISETLGFFEETESEKTASLFRDFVESVLSAAAFTQRLLARMEYQHRLVFSDPGPCVTVITEQDGRNLTQEGIVRVPTSPVIQTTDEGHAYYFRILGIPQEYRGADVIVLHRYRPEQEWDAVFKGKVDNRGRIYVRIPIEEILAESSLDDFEIRIFSSLSSLNPLKGVTEESKCAEVGIETN